ncbi:hypothetical protein [Anaerotignum lactatifermentans]|nr:hypothetical protein [Anaerotignum lactatifermentans]
MIYAFAKEKRRKGALLSDKNDKDVELLEYADAYIQDMLMDDLVKRFR